MPSLKEELVELMESSLSIASMEKDAKARFKERLLALPENEMAEAVKALHRERQEQYEKMKGLVDKIEESGKNLKKTFLKEREKDEKKDADDQARNLMDKLDGIN
jgi:hypothetical protein